MESSSIVLQNEQILQKTKRIAFQIYENTFESNEIFIGGIAGDGFTFAERIVDHLKKVSDQDIQLFKISINKQNPISEPVELDIADSRLENAIVILVDDVINSGKTMMYAVNRVLSNNQVKLMKVATLVNRTHRRYPVLADFVGLNIATTLQDNIIVELGDQNKAFLG